METLQPTTSFFGWPVVIAMFIVFVLNFFFARHITSKLVKEKHFKKNSVQVQNALVLWFFPIAGGLGLLFYLWYCRTLKYTKSFTKWLFLKHA